MDNLLIEASAGTGKTQALGVRLVELLRAGVDPKHIVALTFSRAAAGEIFGRFVSLLAKSAESDPANARFLRKVLSTQHLSQIGTLDSFLMRMLRAFPLELGLSGDLEMMDASASAAASNAVAFSVLRKTDETLKNAFVDAFLLAMNREDVRSFAQSYRKFVSAWHKTVTALPDESAWGDPVAIWGRDPAFAHVTSRELSAAADAVSSALAGAEWDEFSSWVRSFRGSFAGVKGYAKKLLESDDIFSRDAFSFVFRRREVALTREQTLCVRDALMCVFGYVVRMKLELARGIKRVISAYETAYDRDVRRKGRLVFDDIPRLVSLLRPDVRSALEYRMDSRIDAWALDEFQDTSRSQWAALYNLIDEAKQSGGAKTLFVVGDRKQAIYGWREGDVGIFRSERDSGFYTLANLHKTYRSCPVVIEAVNRVFARGRIFSEFPAWECPEHESARDGVPGFVRVAEAPGVTKESFIEPVFSALRAVLGEKMSDPRRRGVTAAVLVRNNDLGALMADGLKELGFEGVVWEGESPVAQTPALSGFLDLFQLADHPGDVLAYRHFAMTPLAAAKYPRGVPSAAEISREMALSFTSRGIARTLRELRALLPDDPLDAWSRFTEERFVGMLRAAEEFERLQRSGTRLADFPGFLRSKKKRTVAADGFVKIMTIHRSKGLGFDFVVLPLYEHKGLCAEPSGPLFGDGWVLPDPGARVAKAVGGLEAAYTLRKNRAEQEALCAYYVAMTRAKKAMTIVLHPEGGALRFSDIVRSASLGDLANPDVAVAPDRPDGGKGSDNGSNTAERGKTEEPFVRGPRKCVKRRLPSLGFESGMSAGDLFSPVSSVRAAALQRGVEIHSRYEALEWIAPEEAKTPLERSLVRPSRFVALWREKPFETFADGVWSSGRFDRVVFDEDGGFLRATVMDFKTNRPLRGEDPSQFAQRMRAAYYAQMTAYRAAVSQLAAIEPENVSLKLLLTATGDAVDV